MEKTLARAAIILPGARLGDQTFALRLLARGLAGSADGLACLPSSLFGWLFIGPAALHLAKKAFALELLLQHPEGLIDIVVSNSNLQGNSPFKLAE